MLALGTYALTSSSQSAVLTPSNASTSPLVTGGVAAAHTEFKQPDGVIEADATMG